MKVNCDVCFFGHSQIEMSDFQKDFPSKRIIELGYPGDNLKGMIKRVKQIKYTNPRKIFLMAGTNSLCYTDEEFEKDYKLLVEKIREMNPKTNLFVFSILPQSDGKIGNVSLNTIIKKRNEFIKEYCFKNNIIYIDINSEYSDENGNLINSEIIDGIHLKRNCYGKISKAIAKYIN